MSNKKDVPNVHKNKYAGLAGQVRRGSKEDLRRRRQQADQREEPGRDNSAYDFKLEPGYSENFYTARATSPSTQIESVRYEIARGSNNGDPYLLTLRNGRRVYVQDEDHLRAKRDICNLGLLGEFEQILELVEKGSKQTAQPPRGAEGSGLFEIVRQSHRSIIISSKKDNTRIEGFSYADICDMGKRYSLSIRNGPLVQAETMEALEADPRIDDQIKTELKEAKVYLDKWQTVFG